MRRNAFQGIADPTRRAMLSLIALHAMTPGALAAHFDSCRQAVPKHIQVLTACKLIKQEQSGREMYYQINPKKMKEIADWLAPFHQLWKMRFNQLDEVLKNLKSGKNGK
ncbi:MAG: ArsR/SmtB family transcription factor [Bacteroidia bacterium]